MLLVSIMKWLIISVIMNWSGSIIGINGSIYIILCVLVLSPIISWYILYNIVCIEIYNNSIIYVISYNLISYYYYSFNISISISVMLMVVVILLINVSYVICIYILLYMYKDKNIVRFISLIMLFTFNMIILIISNDIILLFIGWEMIGIISLLLISYYNNRIEASRAGLKAIFYNRIGDITLLLFIVFSINVYSSNNMLIYSILISYYNYNINNINILIGICIIISAWSKSAQLGFQPWLLDAMEGFCKVIALKLIIKYNSNNNSIKKQVPNIDKYQLKVIAGLLLSDGHLRNQNSSIRPTGNYRLEFTFKAGVIDYCNWIKFELLGSICTNRAPTPYPKENPTQYWFSTRNHFYFTYLYNLWYDKGIKKIPSNDYLYKYFYDISLAHCIMGDGYWDKSGKTVCICTECFSKVDVERFISFIKDKFDLVATTKKRNNSYRIRFSSKKDNLSKLRKLVLPHMHKVMLYKLGDNVVKDKLGDKVIFNYLFFAICRALIKFHYMREHPLSIWSTQELVLFGKTQILGQSAGNQTLPYPAPSGNEVGSSETTRGTFNQWLVGFTEGDGSFIVKKNGYLELKITQSSIDSQVLLYVKKELGFGIVSVQDKNNNTHQFKVRDKEGLIKIISIFNGNLLTEYRKNQFKLWLDAFNKKYKMNIQHIQSTKPFSLDNAWLSGFTDAEGCFTVSCNERSSKYTQVFVRYVLSQKGAELLLTNIGIMLNGTTYEVKGYTGHNMCVNLTKLDKVINYFSKYPLKTKKYIDYLNWLKVYKLVIDKRHFDAEGLNQIKYLMSKINKKCK